MVLIRCAVCGRYHSLRHKLCNNCGAKDGKTRAYYVRIGTRYMYSGNSLTISRAIEAKYKLDKRLSTIKEYRQPRSISFSAFIDKHFQPHYEARNRRPDAVAHILTYLKGQLTDKPIREITRADIDAVVADIRHRRLAGTGRLMALQTQHHYIKTLRRVFNYAIELAFIDKSPMVRVANIKFDNKITRYLTDDEQDRLLSECKKSRSPVLYRVVMLALYTGMRAGELRALKREHIRDGNIYLPGGITKSGKGRVIPISEHIRDILDGEFGFDADVTKSFLRVCQLAGLGRFRFHDLRHTFGSRLAQAGVPLYTIKELMGHSDMALTQRYAHLSSRNMREAIDRL
ncbi:site-specific integrase [Deferribacterales bacterium RsTz2092]|nr:integrase [Deferribacterales bacterium]